MLYILLKSLTKNSIKIDFVTKFLIETCSLD